MYNILPDSRKSDKYIIDLGLYPVLKALSTFPIYAPILESQSP